MKFKEKKAKKIIAKHGLSSNTLNTWKHRQAIPDRYDKRKNYVKRSPITGDALLRANRLLRVGWICWKHLKINQNQITAHKAKRNNLDLVAYDSLVSQIKEVGFLLLPYINTGDKCELLRIIEDKRIKHTNLFPAMFYRFFATVKKGEELEPMVAKQFHTEVKRQYSYLSKIIEDLPRISKIRSKQKKRMEMNVEFHS